MEHPVYYFHNQILYKIPFKIKWNLSLDTSELKEAEKVRASQEKALKALQDYTVTHFPDSPSKFGELLLRIPELQRTCQVIVMCIININIGFKP